MIYLFLQERIINLKPLNDKLRIYANENNIEHIDKNEVWSDDIELQLKDKYKTDGVHLTPLVIRSR